VDTHTHTYLHTHKKYSDTRTHTRQTHQGFHATTPAYTPCPPAHPHARTVHRGQARRQRACRAHADRRRGARADVGRAGAAATHESPWTVWDRRKKTNVEQHHTTASICMHHRPRNSVTNLKVQSVLFINRCSHSQISPPRYNLVLASKHDQIFTGVIG